MAARERLEQGSAAAPVRVLVVGAPERMNIAVDALGEQGCDVTTCENPKRVSDACDDAWPDAVVLDVTVASRDAALEALDWLRRSAQLGVVVVTEPHDADARVHAVRLRADDAVAPVDSGELVARVAAIVRRSQTRTAATGGIGDMSIDRANRTVSRRGTPISLTQRELQVLEVLIEQPGRVVSKDTLLDRVWGQSRRSANAVEVQISALRRKLHDAGPPVIHTSHGEGYVFRPVVTTVDAKRSYMIAERERLVREREEAVARRTKLLRQMEEQLQRRSSLYRNP